MQQTVSYQSLASEPGPSLQAGIRAILVVSIMLVRPTTQSDSVVGVLWAVLWAKIPPNQQFNPPPQRHNGQSAVSHVCVRARARAHAGSVFILLYCCDLYISICKEREKAHNTPHNAGHNGCRGVVAWKYSSKLFSAIPLKLLKKGAF